jgi:hypothetical protein
MGLIGPLLTLKDLQHSALETKEGRGQALGLPGVKADAKTADPPAFKKNLELAKRISAAVTDLKITDTDKETGKKTPRFVLGWRLYPNADNAYWKSEALLHACGCGCSCFGPFWNGSKRAPKGRTRSAPKSSKKRATKRK